MPGGPAGRQDNLPRLGQVAGDGFQSAQHHAHVAHVQPPAQAGPHHLRLLEYLLEHEMLVSALGDLLQRPLDLLDLLGHRDVVQRHGLHAIASNDGHFVVVEIDYIGGVLDDRRCVGGDDVLPAAHADNQRAALAGDHQLVRFATGDHRDTVGPADLRQSRAHRVLQNRHAVVVEAPDQLTEDFRIGIATKDMSLADEELLQFRVVFNDAVVDQGDIAAVIAVGMGVGLVGFTVGGPAGMGDADGSGGYTGIVGDLLFQLCYASWAFGDAQLSVVIDADARGIVPAILQALEALYQNAASLLRPDVTYNSAHS